MSSGAGAPQLANTRINTNTKKWNIVCRIGRFAGGASKFICSSFFAFSSLRKMNDIIRPIITENEIAPIIRAIPISVPSMRHVRIIDSMLIAGPE